MRRAAFWVAVAVALGGCGEAGSSPAVDTGDAAAGDIAEYGADAAETAEAAETEDAASPDAPLAVVPGPLYALVGAPVTLSGEASTGATSFRWDLGNGTTFEGAVAMVTYDVPGRYQAVLTVTGPGGQHSASTLVSVTLPATHAPVQAGTVARLPQDRFVVVSPDSDELVVVSRGASDADGFVVAERVGTCHKPRTVTGALDEFAVACQGDDRVQLWRDVDGALALQHDVGLPPGSRPYAVVPRPTYVAVTLQGTGELAYLPRIAGQLRTDQLRRFPVVADARGMATWVDGRLAVSRWRSPSDPSGGAQVALVDPDTEAVDLMTLAVDPQAASDTEIGGVPNYLDQVLVSPTGREAVVPSTQVNILEGVYRNGTPLSHDTAARAAKSSLWVATSRNEITARKQFDNRGLATARVFRMATNR